MLAKKNRTKPYSSFANEHTCLFCLTHLKVMVGGYSVITAVNLSADQQQRTFAQHQSIAQLQRPLSSLSLAALKRVPSDALFADLCT